MYILRLKCRYRYCSSVRKRIDRRRKIRSEFSQFTYFHDIITRDEAAAGDIDIDARHAARPWHTYAVRRTALFWCTRIVR